MMLTDPLGKLGFALYLLLGPLAGVHAEEMSVAQYDAESAVTVSQGAVGNTLHPLELTASDGRPVNLADYRGKPLLISMIFTSCHHVCPAITRHLYDAVQAARDALGEDSFQVVTVGFDTPVDTPAAMRRFARKQGVDDPNWAFLSGSADTMQALVEPLKELIYNRPQPGAHPASGLLNRIKLFCTVYDPNTGRYRFDYSLFVGIGVGAVIVLAVIGWLLLEILRRRRTENDSGAA